MIGSHSLIHPHFQTLMGAASSMGGGGALGISVLSQDMWTVGAEIIYFGALLPTDPQLPPCVYMHIVINQLIQKMNECVIFDIQQIKIQHI